MGTAVPDPDRSTGAAPRPATLHGYFRSAAAWRVRIALALKNLPVEQVSQHLRRGEQRAPAFLKLNPQGLVPALVLDDGAVLTQSLAILEWLDEAFPDPPLLPPTLLERAHARAFALALAADTHPVQNLKVLERLRAAGWAEDAVQAWAAETNREGLAACEALLADQPGPYCFGAGPGIADICLVPQLGNGRRFGVDVGAFPKLLEIETRCMALPAFADAAPARQPNAE